MKTNSKLVAFKLINKKILNRVDILELSIKEFEPKNISSEKVLYTTTNNETTCDIIRYGEQNTTKTIINDKPKRITCLSGEINLIIPHFDEKIKMKPQDSQLIPSNTYHIIESLKESEIIVIYKNVANFSVPFEELLEMKTIYNKL